MEPMILIPSLKYHFMGLQKYQNLFFLLYKTMIGICPSAIYTEDCIFEDPIIRFQELYSCNLKLLVPIFDSPSIGLENIEKVIVLFSFPHAIWKLRTYLKLPWRPLISIDGSTVFELDDKFEVNLKLLSSCLGRPLYM
ncbi:hypothetical protein UlMin_038219 [Ulmus minor]